MLVIGGHKARRDDAPTHGQAIATRPSFTEENHEVFADRLPSLLYDQLAQGAAITGLMNWIELSEVHMSAHHPNPNSRHASSNAAGVPHQSKDR